MKCITVYFDNKEFEKIKKEKGTLTWREYIIKKTTGG